jgi:hypothetical protein
MPRRIVRSIPIPRPGLAAALLVLLVAGHARAQVPVAVVPEVRQRDGMLTRMRTVESTLPPDKKRDYYYNTRWDDDPYYHGFYNVCHGGLYGWPWKQNCSQSFYPYFYGAPGTSTLSECCRPMHPLARLPINLVHPFRPVGMYYGGGSYTPIYSLDPLVPGPGPYPWPHYLKRCLGG